MTLLETKDYYKAAASITTVRINTLFARAVIEQKVQGKIYVDNPESPQTFYILHPYGMSLLFGKSNNEKFNQKFKNYVLNINEERCHDEWMQTYPNDWDIVLRNLFEQPELIMEFDVRVNFKFNEKKYVQTKQTFGSDNIRIHSTTENDFKEMAGTVIPSKFWKDSNDFVSNSIGVSVYYDNRLASIAFAAYIEGNTLELGIETNELYRGKHLAYKACSALLDYCLDNGFNPVWACRLENAGSYKLAQALGFEVSYQNPYYRLIQI